MIDLSSFFIKIKVIFYVLFIKRENAWYLWKEYGKPSEMWKEFSAVLHKFGNKEIVEMLHKRLKSGFRLAWQLCSR